jgi:alcohol oxidase
MDIQHNLFLRTNSRVSRVILEGNKAVDVVYVPARNRAHQGKSLKTIFKAASASAAALCAIVE